MPRFTFPVLTLVLAGCPASPVTTTTTPAPGAVEPPAPPTRASELSRYQGVARASLPALERQDFNRLAALENVPLFWLQDALAPGNLVELEDGALSRYVQGQAFTPAFDALYARLVDRRRIEAVSRELTSGWLTAVVTDLRNASDADKKLVRHIQRAARVIEDLYAVQTGAAAVQAQPLDSPSKELYRRNQGYWCEGPQTRDDAFCNGLLSFPKQASDAYPRGTTQDEAWCEKLRNAPDAKALMDPFSVVREKRGALVAVPYLEVYGDKMRAVATELKQASALLGDTEAAFKKYLEAAARGFETNNWNEADEAWVAMNSHNSAWYLRIAPDEVYFDPCNSKAGFHVSFARINPALVEWQNKLTPLRQDMEQALAAQIGPPYKAREVSFALPDFIDIVLNAGDARNAFGATVGQSLPNWGPVSERGDGRTVVMTNLYSGPDSRAVYRQKAALLFDPGTLKALRDDDVGEYLDILLHEASHNFGPHSDYKLDGKPPREVFGGLTASILEELKAQTGALWFTEWLRQKGVIDDAMARATHTGSMLWCFGQISRGLLGSDGKYNVYPTLAAIQVGFLVDEGALVFDPALDPAGSGDKGRWRLVYSKFVPAVNKLMRLVGQMKAGGDKAGAEALIRRFTEGEGLTKIHEALVKERVLRFPKESFVYAVRM
ncbi:MAG: hypothetical protein ABIJ09_10655 [Pseudomonadota bacterium]